jgi:hypothetical protein
MWNKIKGKKGTYMVLSLLISMILWLYVDATVEPEAQVTLRNVPVTFSGVEELEEEGLMITEGEDATVTLRLVGARGTVSQIDKSNLRINVDLPSQVTEAGTQMLDYTISWPNNISAGSVKVESRTVNAIAVTVVKTVRKTVGIQGIFNGSVGDGCLSDVNKFVFSTSEVTVSGQEELVNQVDHAAVILSEKGLEDTWKGKLPLILVDSDGNELSQEELTLSESEVDVVFPVSHVKKIQLAVTIVEGGGATAEDVSYTVKPDTLTVSGTNEDLEKLDTFNVGTVDLADVVTSEKTSFAIELPDGISNVSGTTVAVVDLTMDSSLVTRRVTTSDIRLVNVPENVTAQLVTDTLEVRIRGSKNSMNLLDQGDVYAEIDLSDIPEDAYGNFTLVAKVKVKGMSDVGAVGTDEVVVNLS